MGIVLAMEMCDRVTVYEYIPTVNYSAKCHYWEEMRNADCTVGHWHPSSWEKKLMTRFHVGDEKQLYIDGKLILDGYAHAACDEPS